MWAQLAMAGVKSLQDAQNRKNDIASNVITQKYSPWTGQTANFSAIGKNNTLDNLISGYGAGMLQDKMDAQEAAEQQAKKVAEYKDDADFYSKLSANPSSVGVSPVASKSAFAVAAQNAGRAPAGRSPAINEGGNQVPSGPSLPSFMQGENPWVSMAQQPLGPYQPDFPMQAPKQDPTSAARQNLWAMIPNSLPIKQGW